jgi:hypothetical protein
MKRKVRYIEEYLEYGESTIVVILYNSSDEVIDIMTNQYNIKIEKQELGDDLIGFVKFTEHYIFLGLINSFKYQDLIHELMHLTHGVLSGMDIPLNDHTEETYARYIDMLFVKVINMLKANKVKLPII